MKKKPLILISILIILFCAGFIYWFVFKPEMISETAAIETIKSKITELKDYPSDQLPPKSVKTEKAGDGWYVAFIQEGSGRPIISAKCFFVKNIKSITSIGEYVPKIGEDSVGDFSAKICLPSSASDDSSQKCQLETCHGLDIVCGSHPPDVCTEIYELGDKCLQYAKCGVQNGKCQQIQNSQFTQCKLCVQKCTDANKNDNIKLFECESKCE
jgi:hypothetical protein